MGRRCQERPEEEETHKMDRTIPRSPQNGKQLLRRPRLYQSCSAKQEEEEGIYDISWATYQLNYVGQNCRS